MAATARAFRKVTQFPLVANEALKSNEKKVTQKYLTPYFQGSCELLSKSTAEYKQKKGTVK